MRICTLLVIAAISTVVLSWDSLMVAPRITEEQIERFRSMESAGVDEFAARYERELDRPHPPREIREALDRICAQRDCHASRLYWHTDLERAIEVAREEGKPIVSLRLLGNLDEEYSCANSRFFRSALYANREVADLLREKFVLHWQSVRPIPVVQIDMGDGRRIKRTVTGNSAHHVLDENGRPLDVFPGLYGPQAFVEMLSRVHGVFASTREASAEERALVLADYHQRRLRSIERVWQFALGSREAQGRLPIVEAFEAGSEMGFVDARRAGLVAITKAAVELPLVDVALGDFGTLETKSDSARWDRLAETYRDRASLDERSRQLLAEKLGRRDGVEPDRGTLEETVRLFEQRMALDAVRNELLLHRRVHQWFADGEVGTDPGELTDRVYAELFLTPNEDPWLGLVPAHTYSALDGDGVFLSSQRVSE